MSGVRAGHEADLRFETAIGMVEDGSFEASLGVRNVSDVAFAGDKRFNGQMELRYAESGELRASASLVPLQSLAPGELVEPLTWKGELAPGGYILIWGAEGYGETKFSFGIFERGGFLYLGGADQALDTPGGDDGTAMPDLYVTWAVADLGGREGAREADIRVVEVARTEFPDASLGVPEPDKTYAKVLTPGYVIELALGDALYTYHAAGERVVLVPADASGGQAAKQVVGIPEIGLSFAVPGDWERLASGLVWAPDGVEGVRLGVNWVVLEPPAEPEAALLPSPAQVLDSEPVDLGWSQGRRATLEVFAPEGIQDQGQAAVVAVETHVLVTVVEGTRRLAIDLYLSAPTAEILDAYLGALEELAASTAWVADAPGGPPASIEIPDDWQSLAVEGPGDAGWRFTLAFPPDWMSKETNAAAGGGPDDWPVVVQRQFYPEAWAERLERTGPPAPNAPVTYVPLMLEVVVGSEAQLRRVYVEPARSELLDVNGLAVVREFEGEDPTMTVIRYIVRHPENPEVWLVLTDVIGGFLQRIAGNETVAEVIPMVAWSVAVEK
jgi:hypothetical protein